MIGYVRDWKGDAMPQIRDEMVPIRTAARMLGVHPNTLRNWEKQGIIHPLRTTSGHRRYSRADIDRLLIAPRNGNAATQKSDGA